MATKKARSSGRDELRREYDLSKLSNPFRGKYHRRAMNPSNLVLLDPDVADVFPSTEAVNDALRGLMRVARAKVKPVGRTRRKSA
ncbi:MAG: hypothetical protein HZA53_13360 [Planctomycetes bacterium]|nr:hypothetical protein [Planctomycetota bacterium]